jgi:anti-sigma-K factor RskA
VNRRELAAAYLLDELDGTQRSELEGRLAADPELQQEIESMRPLVSQLAALPEAAWPAPPEPAAEVAASKSRVTGRRWTVRPGAAIASLLVVAAIGLGLGVLLDGGGGGEETAPAIVLTPLRPTAGEQATVAMPRAGEMVFRAEGLAPLQAGQYYELWLMSDPTRTVPVASFQASADGSALVRVPLPADPAAFRYFDVSLQSVGAGTGHSTVSVLRGQTS